MLSITLFFARDASVFNTKFTSGEMPPPEEEVTERKRTSPRELDGEGRIIVSDSYNHRIEVFENDGSFIRSFGSFGSSEAQFNCPWRVVVDGDGNIVVSDFANHQIKVIDIEGNLIRCFGTRGSGDSQLYCPISVDVDGAGRIVVCDQGNRRVSVFEKDGTFLFSFGKDRMKKPDGVVVDSFGTIIVSDEHKSIEFWN